MEALDFVRTGVCELSIKGNIVNILGPVASAFPVSAIQDCLGSTKGARDNIRMKQPSCVLVTLHRWSPKCVFHEIIICHKIVLVFF